MGPPARGRARQRRSAPRRGVVPVEVGRKLLARQHDRAGTLGGDPGNVHSGRTWRARGPGGVGPARVRYGRSLRTGVMAQDPRGVRPGPRTASRPPGFRSRQPARATVSASAPIHVGAVRASSARRPGAALGAFGKSGAPPPPPPPRLVGVVVGGKGGDMLAGQARSQMRTAGVLPKSGSHGPVRDPLTHGPRPHSQQPAAEVAGPGRTGPGFGSTRIPSSASSDVRSAIACLFCRTSRWDVLPDTSIGRTIL